MTMIESLWNAVFCFDHGGWRKSVLMIEIVRIDFISIYKKGHHSKPGNYRPICLNSQVCKVMVFFILEPISEHLKQHKLILDSQHGFRPKRSLHIGCNNPNYDYFMGDELIESIDVEKDPGVHIHKSLKVKEQVNYLVKKAHRILGTTRRTYTDKSMKNIFRKI